MNASRTIITYNFYTSIDWAIHMLKKRTHFLRTLRANHKGNPKDVVGNLKKAIFLLMKMIRGICVIKWHDKNHILYCQLSIPIVLRLLKDSADAIIVVHVQL